MNRFIVFTNAKQDSLTALIRYIDTSDKYIDALNCENGTIIVFSKMNLSSVRDDLGRLVLHNEMLMVFETTAHTSAQNIPQSLAKWFREKKMQMDAPEMTSTKHVLFEGKVTLANREVDFRIFKEYDEEGNFLYYSYATNPQLRDKGQMSFHDGQTLRAADLETLLYRFKNVYKTEFSKIVEERENPNYNLTNINN